MNTAVTGLIFDLDNTLLDRNATFFKVAESFYAEHLSGKTSVTREDAVAAMMRWDEDGYPDRATMFERWVTEWPETGLDVEAVMEWYRAAIARHVEPDHKVNDFLAWLNERGVPWGIVTNGSSNQHVKCRVAGLAQLAPFIIVSEDAGYAKPDPRIFRDALQATGIKKPSQVMFVGDNPIADIDGSKRCGMQAAWVQRGRQYPTDLQPPDHIIDCVTEVQDIISVTT